MHASPDADFGNVVAVGRMSELAALYDGFILDQWGVLHDGTSPYAGAPECLRALRAAGKRIVVLSNSGKRERANLELMDSMGFDVTLIDRFISAGEDTRNALESGALQLGRRCYAFTRDGDLELLEGLGLDFVTRIADAEFLAVIGNDSPKRSVQDYESELQAGIAHGLPMVCANPDLARFTPQGLIEAAGVLARRYEALGGTVHYHGKPHPPIYRSCMTALGCANDKVIAIGDSLEHDVLGAARVGIASALIPGGVHGPDLGIAWGELPTPTAWRSFVANAPARPDYLLRTFNW